MMGGFATVRFRAYNLESGRSAYGVGGPKADLPLSGAAAQFAAVHPSTRDRHNSTEVV